MGRADLVLAYAAALFVHQTRIWAGDVPRAGMKRSQGGSCARSTSILYAWICGQSTDSHGCVMHESSGTLW